MQIPPEPPRPAEIGDRVRLKADVDVVGVVDGFADIDGIQIVLVQYPNGIDMVPVADIEILAGPPRDSGLCRVYWGSHGCEHERGHDGPHVCVCGFGPPYYGDETRFYGEDSHGLPQVSE